MKFAELDYGYVFELDGSNIRYSKEYEIVDSHGVPSNAWCFSGLVPPYMVYIDEESEVNKVDI